MPTYEYYCNNCDFDFELFQSIKSDPYTNCPKCKKKLERKISAPAGILFKGSGFYITDYKNSKNNTTSTGTTRQSKNELQDKGKSKETESVKQDKKDTGAVSKESKVEKFS
jgi:putative FmdB family regulatory protein